MEDDDPAMEDDDPAMEELLTRARGVWCGLAGVPVAFPGTGAEVVASPGSLLCPPGWVGVVALGGAAIVTAPGEEQARQVRAAIGRMSAGALTDPAALRSVLPVADVLGPAVLAYHDGLPLAGSDLDGGLLGGILGAEGGSGNGMAGGVFSGVASGVQALPAGHDDVRRFLDAVPGADRGESGLPELTSPAYVIRDDASAGGAVVAAAGYRRWPGDVAHLGVLTAPSRRGHGLARIVAAAAVADARANDLLPQWRARPEPSRRVARALGFRELGSQLSLRLTSGSRAG